VLTHLARNAEGSTRLLTWARTGMPSYEYESADARAADIEAGAGRPAKVLIADVRRTVGALEEAATGMPPQAWRRLIRYTGGQEHPADVVLPSRLAEVLIHHVDLDLGFTPEDWPRPFVADMLTLVDVHPVPESAFDDTEFPGHLRDRTRRLDHQIRGFFPELRCVIMLAPRQ